MILLNIVGNYCIPFLEGLINSSVQSGMDGKQLHFCMANINKKLDTALDRRFHWKSQ